MSKVNYEYKSYVLKEHSELIHLTNKCKRYSYAQSLLDNYGVVSSCLRDVNNDSMSLGELSSKCLKEGLYKEFSECLKINDASYKRTKRLKERIKSMLMNGDCIFITLTFNDDYLSNSTYKERRVAVSRYLKQFNCPYVANIDFGSENGREHYHAVINASSIRLESWRKFGNINVERIRNRNIDLDNVRLAKYICKLTNHAIKETTKRCSLIYSR